MHILEILIFVQKYSVYFSMFGVVMVLMGMVLLLRGLSFENQKDKPLSADSVPTDTSAVEINESTANQVRRAKKIFEKQW